MSQYTKSTNFATKDNLPTGDPLKIVKGTEIDTEYNNIATAIATKTDNASAAITGGTIVGITDLAIADGGTGASTATAALNNLLPSQTSAANKYLQSDGTNASWDAVTLSTSDITGTLAVANGGTGVTSSTGTGSVVLSNSPTLVTPALGAATASTLDVSGNVTLSGGTANAVPYLNGSKVLTSSTALYFDGSNLGVGGSASYRVDLGSATSDDAAVGIRIGRGGDSNSWTLIDSVGGATNYKTFNVGTPTARWSTSTNGTSFTEQMRLNPTGLGIKNNNPAAALDVTGSALVSGSVTAASFAGALNGTVGATTASTGAFTTLTTSSTVTHNGGTANGVTYLNGSKVLTSGSALTFDGAGNLTSTGAAGASSGEVDLKLVDSTSGKSLILIRTGATFNYAGIGGAEAALYTANNNLNLVADGGAIKFNAGSLGTTTEGMRLTSTGLGIGTSSPSQKLTVLVADAAQSTSLQAATGRIRFRPYVDATNGAIVDVTNTAEGAYLPLTLTGSTLRLFGNNGTGATIDASGNLGLGVTPSTWSGFRVLQMPNGASLYANASAAATYLGSNHYYDGAYKYATTDKAAQYYQFQGEHVWLNAASGTAGNAITFTQAMTLDASGSLVIGGTTAVAGSVLTLQETASLSTALTMKNRNSTQTWKIAVDAVSVDDKILAFIDNATSTVRMALTDTGNLLVGTTNTSPTAGIGNKITVDAAAPYIASVGSASTNSNVNYTLYSTGAAAYRFYVGYGGTVYATSTTITAISDQRLKENIRDLDDGLSAVMALKPRKFDWKEGKGADIKNARGFIAQEFETVFPDMIEEWRDPAPEGEEAYKAINANLIPTLVKAIQELKAEFDAYKASHP